MRKSQFMAWPLEIVESYYADLIQAREQGRNLLFEKYAFMMEDTAPEEYRGLEKYLPKPSDSKMSLITEIVEIQVMWAEMFMKEYPVYGGSGRPVRISQARWGETSIETYQRGELLSYGEETVRLYSEYVKDCQQKGKNLTYMVRENMAKLAGYRSLEEVESNLEKNIGKSI